MAHRDFRKFLEALEKAGELARVKAPVDWDEEIGAIYQEVIAQGGPSPLFENIKGYRDTHGQKISMHTDGNMRRVCIALGVSEEASRSELIKLWRERSKNIIKPILVSGAPCKEIIHKGKEVNLFEFPIPKLHPEDGGRYILTWSAVITKDPDSDWINVGTYRGMLLDENSIGMWYHPNKHWGSHGEKYREMRKAMPVAAAIGVDPVLMFASASNCPFNISEYDIAGGIRLEPLELVKAETLALEVPAGAEIVLEGEMSLEPSTFRPEGPFGEWPGHYSGLGAEPRPVFKVNCVTHRKDPILTVTSPGMAPSVAPELKGNKGEHAYMSIVSAAQTLDYLESVGVRGVKDVSGAGSGGNVIIVSIDQQYFGHAKQVASALWAMPTRNKYVILVDSDIDVSDLHKVFIAIGNRSRGGKSITIFPDTSGNSLDPAEPPEEKTKLGETARWDRVLIDATWPYEWEPRKEWGGLKHPPPCRADVAMIEKVRKRWQELGLSPVTEKRI